MQRPKSRGRGGRRTRLELFPKEADSNSFNRNVDFHFRCDDLNLVKTGPAKYLSVLSVFSIGKWQESGRADLHQTSGCRAGCGSASVPAADTRGQ